MSGMKWGIKIGLLGILIGLFMVISRNGVSEEPKNKDDQQAYDKYVKIVNSVLKEIDKINFALESGADPKVLKKGLESSLQYFSEQRGTIGEIKRPIISERLMSYAVTYDIKLLDVLAINPPKKDRGGAKIGSHLYELAKGFATITEAALNKNEVITKEDCPLCTGREMVSCYYCNTGDCPNCNKKGCNACDNTRICPVCLGSRSIPCPICIAISRGPGNPSASSITANESSAIASLRTLVAAEAVWNQQDPDGNGIKDYWTYDISCLHRMYRADGQTKVAFIAIDMARADNKPADMKGGASPFGKDPTIEPWTTISTTPKSGYFLRAMLTDEGGKPYNVNEVGANNIKATNNSKFAFVAYPAEYGTTGINTFIVNHEGTIYATDCGSDKTKVVLQWPGDMPPAVKGPGGRNWEVGE